VAIATLMNPLSWNASSQGGPPPPLPREGQSSDLLAPTPRPLVACAVLLPVWGSTYVRRFLDLCLPTLLATGNIPALAQALPTRFVLLTRSSDQSAIRDHPSWRGLAERCEVQIQPIDDLVVAGNHHATVTLAYARALRAAGDAMRETLFLFLVGDQVMADGSLRAVLDRVRSGASGVLAGSLLVDADAFVPLLREPAHSRSSGLVLASRPLASAALAHLHPLNAANIVNISSVHDVDTNRLFWSVDEATLIGRFYLLHMIAIHPEVTDFVVGAPCDYAFIPELCPSNNVAVLTDSDEYLAIEMQERSRGVRSLRPGALAPAQLARSLSRWTTAQHRQNAESTLVFHSSGLPDGVAATAASASRFIAEIRRNLTATPQPHRQHPSWIGMMALQRAGGGLAPGDADRLLGTAPAKFSRAGVLWGLRLRLLGHPPDVTVCHPRWPDFHRARRLIRSCLCRTDHLLLVSASPRAFARWLEPLCGSIKAVETLADAAASCGSAQAFDACVWVSEDAVEEAAVDSIERLLAPHGKLLIFAGGLLADALPSMAADASLPLRMQQLGIELQDIRYVPRWPVRDALQRAMTSAIRASGRAGGLALPFVLAAGALVVGAVLGCNLILRWRRSQVPPRGQCSSVIMLARRSPNGG
jgi:hypothetical protein